MRIDWRRGVIYVSFFVKHHKGKKKEEIQKTKLPKHVERKKNWKDASTNKEIGKKKKDKKTEKRDFHSFT